MTKKELILKLNKLESNMRDFSEDLDEFSFELEEDIVDLLEGYLGNLESNLKQLEAGYTSDEGLSASNLLREGEITAYRTMIFWFKNSFGEYLVDEETT